MTIRDVDVKGKKCLVRCDFNVPMVDGVITDENRINGALPTIKYLVDNGANRTTFSPKVSVLTKKKRRRLRLFPKANKPLQRRNTSQKLSKTIPRNSL